MASNLQGLLEELQQEMTAHADPSKAINMAAYLKDQFACFGIKSPVRNEIQKKWFPKAKAAQLDHWDLAYNLWGKSQREYQYVAIDYLKKVPKKNYKLDDWKNIEELITTKSWWDTVDLIASNYAGKYFQLFPEQIEPVINRWRASDNMWLNRTCLIFQLKYGVQTDFELLKSLILQYQHVSEFFIQKAIGWSLRQYGKFHPEEVVAFVNEIGLKGLAQREALRRIT